MRDFTKRSLIELLDTILEIHVVLIGTSEEDARLNLLADCQEAIESILEVLTNNGGNESEYTEIIGAYFKLTFMASQNISNLNKYIHELNSKIYALKEIVKDIDITYHILFLPYKASMWDSLESIWMECIKDIRCKCQVVALPYFEAEGENKQCNFVDEKDLFPNYVEIIGHEDYDLSEDLPDVVYIHNPYDSYNKVTQVMSEYFSKNIKKYANKLVYVPYYLTSGKVSNEHLFLPVYKHMDYMIAQSLMFKNQFYNTGYIDKLLPFGSPKIDSLIYRTSNTKNQKVETHLSKIFLNTSNYISLRDGETLFKKLKYVFSVFKSREDVILIWRPHPLLEATLSSMKPFLLDEYIQLKKYFIDENIGFLDESADVTQMVCEADAYIGEESSSLVNYFQVLGKPVFLLDNFITSDETEKKMVKFLEGKVINNEVWLTSNEYSGLFKISGMTNQLEMIEKFDDFPMWGPTSLRMGVRNNKLLLSQQFLESAIVYDVDNKSYTIIETNDPNLKCGCIAAYEDKMFCISAIGTKIIEFNLDSNKTTSYECSFNDNCKKMQTWNCGVRDNELWIPFFNSNLLLKFNMANGEHEFLKVGQQGNGYSGIVVENNFIWLAEAQSGAIYKIDRNGDIIDLIKNDDEVNKWNLSDNSVSIHHSLYNMGDYIVSAPGTSNSMIKVNKHSKHVQKVMSEFWEASAKTHNGYHPSDDFATSMATTLDDNKLLIQRMYDGQLAIYDVNDDSTQEFLPILTEDSYKKLIENENGFEKISKFRPYARQESRIFTLDGFLDDLKDKNLEGVKKEQLLHVNDWVSNIDGTCGIKVHSWIMDRLNEENRNI